MKEELIEKVETVHSDETPIIELIEVEGNEKFLEGVKDSI
jgi:uncharacterized protein involved in tolerance to divalent cations